MPIRSQISPFFRVVVLSSWAARYMRIWVRISVKVYPEWFLMYRLRYTALK